MNWTAISLNVGIASLVVSTVTKTWWPRTWRYVCILRGGEVTQGFIQDFLVWGGGDFVGHCHSVMHGYETIYIFKFSGGGIEAGGRGGGGEGTIPTPPLCMKPWI